MDQNHEHAFLYYRSPEDIRKQEFSHRMRGVDADEVYEFLDLLADQVSSTEVERTRQLQESERLRQENDQLRFENERLRAELQTPREQPARVSHGETQAQAAALLAQAQEVADALVEEAVQHARELMSAARQPRPLENDWGIPKAPTPPPPRDYGQTTTSGSGEAGSSRYGGTESSRYSGESPLYGDTPPAQPAKGVERTFTYRRRTPG
jgi:DivIVA domain-containing protein